MCSTTIHAQLLYGCWISELKSSCQYDTYFTDRTISPSPLWRSNFWKYSFIYILRTSCVFEYLYIIQLNSLLSCLSPQFVSILDCWILLILKISSMAVSNPAIPCGSTAEYVLFSFLSAIRTKRSHQSLPGWEVACGNCREPSTKRENATGFQN